ncbi:MAG: hypothetical protein MGU50_23560 [Trichodesmium sp. MAG_R02]|nr:hypothetical protein [Trichodesmium sp. MAG_R02]
MHATSLQSFGYGDVVDKFKKRCKICQYIGKALLFQGTLIINILVFCH